MKNSKKLKISIAIIMAILAIIAIVFVLVKLMQGNTTTETKNIDTAQSDALRCTSGTTEYPFFTYDNSTRKDLKIDLVFAGNELDTIALSYTLYYGSSELVAISEAQNHAVLNISFQNNGLGADAFNAKYTKLDDNLRLNLYKNSIKMNGTIGKYFLVNADEAGNLPKNPEQYRANYEAQGLTCEKNN